MERKNEWESGPAEHYLLNQFDYKLPTSSNAVTNATAPNATARNATAPNVTVKSTTVTYNSGIVNN